MERNERSHALRLLKKKLAEGTTSKGDKEVKGDLYARRDSEEKDLSGNSPPITTCGRESEQDNQYEEVDGQKGTVHDEVIVPGQRQMTVIIKEPKAKPTVEPTIKAVENYAQKTFKKLFVKWSCQRCQRECIPVREESRCLCGHRYKEHPSTKEDTRVKDKAHFKAFACTSAKCSCHAFFYVVAEGAWILRCRCKHKHTDHDPSQQPFRCKKPKCSCDGFDSPWVCNCDHQWSDHRQDVIEKEFQPLELLQQQWAVAELNQVQRTDLLADPLLHMPSKKANTSA